MKAKLLVLSIVVGALVRLSSLIDSTDESQADSGDATVSYQVFDETAAVVIVAGADGAPGVLGVDDDGNGEVDDRFELGASRSDDVCIVLTADQLAQRSASELTLVLQYGAYVPASEDAVQKSASPSRKIVHDPAGKHVVDLQK